jgi:hypothetical protein
LLGDAYARISCGADRDIYEIWLGSTEKIRQCRSATRKSYLVSYARLGFGDGQTSPISFLAIGLGNSCFTGGIVIKFDKAIAL